ncbi:1-(5-phosphoribosyl)-5-amino-4-imidazole-carboxylate carboxylase, partial [bacterium]
MKKEAKLTPEYLKSLLDKYKLGELEADYVLDELSKLPYEDLGFAKLDHHRRVRTGYPEVIFGEGKNPGDVADIFGRLAERNSIVLCTRANYEMYHAVKMLTPLAEYHEECGIIEYCSDTLRKVGSVVVISAGTSDLRVAEEAAVVCELFGSQVTRIF